MHPQARAWFERRTTAADAWRVPDLQSAKATTTVSVVLPALNEQATVGAIVAMVRALADATGLVDEVVVMDSGSTDATAAVARAAGAVVHHRDDVLPAAGSRPGKGEVLWKSLAVTSGDVVVFCDADLEQVDPTYVTGLLGPLLTDPAVHFVKACYDRPLRLAATAGGPDRDVNAGDSTGGRVTELVARPLLNMLFPELSGVVQPLGGEYAARRALLSDLPFAAGYGVDVALLVDAWRTVGLDGLAQVDLRTRLHRHQSDRALGRMAAQVAASLLARVTPAPALDPHLTQYHRDGGSFQAESLAVTVPDRPPMRSVAR